MGTLFSAAPFSRFNLSQHVLGQQSAFPVMDLLSKVGLDPSDISKIQDQAFQDEAQAEYEACKEKDLTSASGLACLAKLAGKVYLKLQEEQKTPAPVARIPVQSGGVSWPLILIGGAAAVGFVYFLATKGGK